MIAKVSVKSKKTKRPASRAGVDQTRALGLLAIGSSGPWEIAIDQTTTGRKRWFAQMEGPSINLSFEIGSLKVVDKTIRFLSGVRERATNGSGPQVLDLGHTPAICLTLIRDDEFTDRYFLILDSKERVMVRLTIAADDLTQLINALCQLQDDIRPA